MKNTLILFSNLLFLLLSSYAQQIELKGVVSIQNSEYDTGTRKYVQGATISADFTLDKITDSKGNFTLEFVGENRGDSTKIEVYKSTLETVNQKDLEEVIIGRSPPLKIFMCKKGELAINKAKYYDVSLKNLYAERDRRIAILEKGGQAAEEEIKRLEEELNLEIYGKNEAIHKLNQEIEKLKEKLPEFAKNLARVNLDDASELYKKAYQFYLDGKIKEAIALIDIEDLLEIGLEATNNLKTLRDQKQIIEEAIALLEQQIEQTINTLRLGAELLLGQPFKYIEAAKFYKAIIAVLESDPFGREKQIAMFQSNAGLVLQLSGSYQEALVYLKKALEINEQVFEQVHPIIATDYSNLAIIYKELGDFEKALTMQEKALEIDKQLFNQIHPRIATHYSSLAIIYLSFGDLEKALKVQEKALKIDKQLFESVHPTIARDYSNLAAIYKEEGDLEKALKLQKKALEIDQQIFNHVHSRIAGDYNNLAQIYLDLRDFETALKLQETALEIDQQIFDQFHPTIARDYNNLAYIYQALGELEKALKLQEKAANIFKKALPTKHPKLNIVSDNLFDIYYDKEMQALLLINPSLNSQNNSIDRVTFKDSKGNKLSINELTETTGIYNYELHGNQNISKKALKLHQEARELGSTGDYKKAKKRLLKAHKLEPKWAYPIYDLAYTYLLQKKHKKSLKYYKLTDKLEPKGFHTSKTALWSLKKENEGIFQKGLYLAYILLDWIQNKDEKKQIARAIIDKYPNYTPAWATLGKILSDNEERLKAIEKALSLDIDQQTKGDMIINKAIVLNLEENSKEAIDLLVELILAEETTYSNIELAKLVLLNIIKEKENSIIVLEQKSQTKSQQAEESNDKSVLPEYIGYVNDFGNFLNEEEEKELTTIIAMHEKQTTNQIAIVTVDSIDPYNSIDAYSLDLANYWGVGQKDKNNGILITIAKEIRKIRIDIGLGLETKLTNSEAKKIIDEVITPEFKQENYFYGLKNGVNEIIEEIKN